MSSDIFDYGYRDCHVHDFLQTKIPAGVSLKVDFVITNPPFNVAEKFITTALPIAKEGCAFFTRLSFLESVKRYENIFSVTPPTKVYIFSERVGLRKGKLDEKTASVTCYCWLVWTKTPLAGNQLEWIPPGTRKRLTLPGDYSNEFIMKEDQS